MADRYDPKLSVRPLSERRPPAAADDSDPLVELARIVSGRSTFDPAPVAKAKTVPASPAANGALSAEPGLANDLESELMNDLQASFATVVPPTKPAAPPPRPAPQPAAAQRPAPAPAAKPVPPPAVAKAPAPAAPAPKPTPQPASTGTPFVPPKVAQPAPRQAAPAQPPAARPSAPPAAARPAAPPPARPAAPPPAARAPQPQAEKPARPAPPPARAERPAPQPVRPAERGDFASASLRPTTQVHADPPAAPAPSGRWEKPEEEDPGLDDANRFAPPRARNWFRANRAAEKAPAAARAPQPPPEPEVTESDHEIFEDLPPTLAEADELYQDDLALDDIAHYGDDDADLPPLVDELPDMGHRRAPRGLLAITALLVVAIAGGAGYYLLRGSNGTSAPPVIAADPSPTKVVPPDDGSQQAADAQNKLIYDRVDPAAKTSDETATNLVTPGNEQIADVNKPTDGADDGNPVSRVIMQGGPVDSGSGAPPKVADSGADGVAPAAADGALAAGDSDGLGPRKVRTVVVRPDGTIVSSEAAPADGSASPALPAGDQGKPPSEVAGSLNVPQGGTSMDTVLEKGGNIPVNADPLAEGQAAQVPAPAGTVPAGEGDTGAAPAASPAAPVAAATPQPPEPAAAAASPDDGAAAAPEPPAKPAAKPQKPVVVAKGEPIDLTPASKPSAAPAAAPADSAAVTGGLSVQVTSQKSEAAALSAFRSMQSRYAQVLGRYQPNVQRADLGDRGTYYRVRVGPFAGDGASRVCAALKAAGGDCIIVK